MSHSASPDERVRATVRRSQKALLRGQLPIHLLISSPRRGSETTCISDGRRPCDEAISIGQGIACGKHYCAATGHIVAAAPGIDGTVLQTDVGVRAVASVGRKDVMARDWPASPIHDFLLKALDRPAQSCR